jgi:hypothetical protein
VIEEESVVHHACNFFAMTGAHILREHYRLPAIAVSGAAFFSLNPELYPLAFAEHANGRVFAGLDGFHSWIESRGYVIDLLAPLFSENLAKMNQLARVPRRAFIKPLSDMASRLPQRGDPEGTFFLIADEECQANMERTHRKPMARDLQTVCSTWYQRPPKKMDTEFYIKDNRAKVMTLRRKDIGISGFW